MNYVNGKFIVTPFSEGLLYGTGVFETILVEERTPLHIEAHFTRLIKGCKALEIDFSMSVEVFLKHISKFIERIPRERYALRVTVAKKGYTYDFMINERDIPYNEDNYEKGFKVKVGNLLKNPTSPLTYIKSICYTDNLLSLREARSMGYNEVLHMNFRGEICEGAISNIFFVKDGIVKTPHPSCGLLEGTTRRRVLDLLEKISLPFEEGHYSLEDILSAEEVFVTNALMGIMPVTAIEDRYFSERDIYNRLNTLI